MIHSVVERVYFPESIDLDSCINVTDSYDFWLQKALQSMLLLFAVVGVIVLLGVFGLEIFRTYVESQGQRDELMKQMIDNSIRDILKSMSTPSYDPLNTSGTRSIVPSSS